MRVRFEKLESKVHKPFFELFGKPRACGKTANEKCELLIINQGQCSRVSGCTDRVGGKVLPKVISDRVHGRLNRGLEKGRNLCAVYEKI